MSFLRVALEEDNSIGESPLVQDELTSFEDDIDAAAFNEEHRVDANAAEAIALENMILNVRMFKDLIGKRNYSQEAANVMAAVIRNQMQSEGCSFINVDMQSGSDDSLKHQLTLESAMDWLNRMLQQPVMDFKHQWNGVTDFFRGLNGKFAKYDEKLGNAMNEYKSKQNELSKTGNKVALNELWFFFKTGDGQMTNLNGGLSFDTNASAYVLETYTRNVITETEKLAGLLSSARLKDEKSVLAFIKAVEGLKSPTELFDKKYLMGKPLFNVTGFEVKRGKRHSAIDVSGKTCTRFAELASGDLITQTGTYSHPALKVAYQLTKPTSSWADLVVANEFTYSADDIEKVIEFGQKYLNNVKAYNNMLSKYSNAINKICKALESFGKEESNISDDVDARQFSNQLVKIVGTYMDAYTLPAKHEVARSLRGAKYCHYLALRMIFNA